MEKNTTDFWSWKETYLTKFTDNHYLHKDGYCLNKSQLQHRYEMWLKVKP